MNDNIKLQMRLANDGKSKWKHEVYQIQIPIAFIRRFGWQKGDTLCVETRFLSRCISIKKVRK
jgi:hypothetical protein